MRSLGPVDGGAATVIEALLEVLGPGGTLVAPTIQHTSGLPRPAFEPGSSPSEVGLLTETLRNWPGAVRSDHPTHSVAAVGLRANELVGGHASATGCWTPWGRTAFGEGSPWNLMEGWSARCLFLGVDFRVCTFFHYAQRQFLEKRQPAYAEAIPLPRFDHKVMGEILLEKQRVRKGRVGDAETLLLGVRPIVRSTLEAIERAEPRLFGQKAGNEFSAWLARKKERPALLYGGLGSATLRWGGRSKTQDETNLAVRLLFLRQGRERFVLLSLPLPFLTPIGRILVACTHVHSGLTPEQTARAIPAVEAAASLAARRAAASMEPVRTGVAREAVAGLARIRRVTMSDRQVYSVRRAVPSTWNPDSKPEFVAAESEPDNDLTVLRIETVSGRPLGCVFHFAVHPIPDLHGYTADWIERTMGNGMVCLPLNGAQGDVDTPFEKPLGGCFGEEQLPKLGGILAGSVVTLWARAEVRDTSLLRVAGSKGTLAVHPQVAQERISDPVAWIAEAARNGIFKAEMSAARIGDFAMVGIPGELSSVLGRTVKDSSKFRFVCPVGLANGYTGYLLSRKALRRGGYEADPSYWSLAAPGAAEKIVRRAQALLAGLEA
jgi:aminoglycoside 3-N-acetyltransferase